MDPALIIIAIIVTIVWYWRPKSKRIPLSVENHVSEVMAYLDAGEDEEELELEDNFLPRGKSQARMIALAKSEFGYLKRTEANRLMVRKFLRDTMRERLMRPSHIAQNVDICVACFFIPSKVDVISMQMGAARLTTNRNEEMATEWVSWYGSLKHMLGFQIS